MEGSGVKDIFKRAFTEKLDAELLAVTSWSVWNRRNKIRAKEAACLLDQIHTLSKERITEFQLLHPTVGKLQHRKHIRWKPSDHGTYKVNYDGATFSLQDKAGLGILSEMKME